MRESAFERRVVSDIKSWNDNVLVLKNNASMIQGIPDRTVYFADKFAMLEFKKSKDAKHQPNQDWYIDKINSNGGFARFIYPENEEKTLADLKKFLEV